jgi:hypothetical protein
LAAGIEDTFRNSSVATEKLPTNCVAEVRCVVTVLLVRCLVNIAASDIPAFGLLSSASQYCGVLAESRNIAFGQYRRIRHNAPLKALRVNEY